MVSVVLMAATVRRRRSHGAPIGSHGGDSAWERRGSAACRHHRWHEHRRDASRPRARSCRSGPTPTTRPTSPAALMAAAARPRPAGRVRARPPPASRAPTIRERGPRPGSGRSAAGRPRRPWPCSASTEHHILGLPDGGLARYDGAGVRPRRAPARRGPARHGPDLRSRRHDVPPRPHRRAPLGRAGLGAARPPGSPAVRDVDARPSSLASASSTRRGRLHDRRPPAGVPAERPGRPPACSTGRSSTASWRRCGPWRPRPGC